MVRSNSFDLTQNRKKNRILQKKVKDEDFSIIYYEDYEKIKSANYNVSQLKSIAKYHGIKVSGNKTQLKERVYDNLKGSYYAVIIQKNVRKYLVKLLIHYKGPGLFKRNKCNNAQDFYSFENLDEIHFNDFFSYTEVDGFIYGFTLYSINELLKTPNASNPYTRQHLSRTISNSLNRIKKLSKIINYYTYTDINIEGNDVEIVQTLEQENKNKLMELFQMIDNYGHITNINWFLDLDKRKLIYFMRELKDIFLYRARLSREVQREIVPNIDPFPYIQLHHMFDIFSLEQIRFETLRVIEKFITLGINEPSRSMGVYYVLGTFTLCSENAADAMPWLYEAVSYNVIP